MPFQFRLQSRAFLDSRPQPRAGHLARIVKSVRGGAPFKERDAPSVRPRLMAPLVVRASSLPLRLVGSLYRIAPD